jgi:hypothetical protein
MIKIWNHPPAKNSWSPNSKLPNTLKGWQTGAGGKVPVHPPWGLQFKHQYYTQKNPRKFQSKIFQYQKCVVPTWCPSDNLQFLMYKTFHSINCEKYYMNFPSGCEYMVHLLNMNSVFGLVPIIFNIASYDYANTSKSKWFCSQLFHVQYSNAFNCKLGSQCSQNTGMESLDTHNHAIGLIIYLLEPSCVVKSSFRA